MNKNIFPLLGEAREAVKQAATLHRMQHDVSPALPSKLPLPTDLDDLARRQERAQVRQQWSNIRGC